MDTEIFLGGLASLILAAVIIAAVTTNKRGDYPDGAEDYDSPAQKGRKSKSDRRTNR